MTVHCGCQNDNRCAACGGFLYARKLNANYYKPEDRHIWHVPGFSGFQHRCPDPIRDGDEARPKGARMSKRSDERSQIEHRQWSGSARPDW
jgi:hypothetical protein